MKLYILFLLLLSSCGMFSRVTAKFTGHDIVCISGVEYIEFTTGASVKYTPEGKISTCRN